MKKLMPTKNILKWTDLYKENTDIYLSYLNEKTIVADENIHTTTLYADFKTWFTINNPNTKIPSNREFINNIRRHKEVKNVRVGNSVSTGIANLILKGVIE